MAKTKGASAATAKGFMYTTPKPKAAKAGKVNTKKTQSPNLPSNGVM